MIVFLGLNGIDLDAPQEEAAAIVFSLAAGEIAEHVLAGWIALALLLLPGLSLDARLS
jgi:death-on-curing protein